VAAQPFAENDAAWGTYRSKRTGITIALPDPAGWTIDDTSRAELVATNARTDSTLTLLSEKEAGLVNRKACEDRARELGLVPRTSLRTIEDAVTVGPDAYDTRIWVAMDGAGTGPLVGHVFVFGAYVRKCLVVHLATRVASSEDEATLAQRLAVARTRLVGGIRMGNLEDVPREVPVQPVQPVH
jgi:hypothetical protein